MLQCVTMCCSVYLRQRSHKRLYIHTPHLQCVAVCCSMLQCAAACCNVLQCVAVCCSVCISASTSIPLICSVLQCIAVCCGVLQRAALQGVAVCCSVLPCVAVCCRVLQRHILLIYTQTCVGCQKVLHILLQTITFIFSHPTHLHSQSSQLLLQCRVSESPMYSTACHHINILTPYAPARQHRMGVGRQTVICVQDICSTACYT